MSVSSQVAATAIVIEIPTPLVVAESGATTTATDTATGTGAITAVDPVQYTAPAAVGQSETTAVVMDSGALVLAVIDAAQGGRFSAPQLHTIMAAVNALIVDIEAEAVSCGCWPTKKANVNKKNSKANGL